MLQRFIPKGRGAELLPVTTTATSGVRRNRIFVRCGPLASSLFRYVMSNRSLPVPAPTPRFYTSECEWPVERQSREFNAYVVEPYIYAPEKPARVFRSVISHFLPQEPARLDPFDTAPVPDIKTFDLLTFPEAFLPADDLVAAIEKLTGLGSFGCVHVGLRPNVDKNHLFLKSDLERLVASLRQLPGAVPTDIESFCTWLRDQQSDKYFNVACLFTIDANGSPRVCLHPKLVKSRFEISAIREGDMEEAHFLALVTLQSTDARLPRVVLQPLICSDILKLTTDRGDNWPLHALLRYPDQFNRLPDHIDIVSVVTCTPQQRLVENADRPRRWQQQFRETFVAALRDDDLARHHFATFILSNFQIIDDRHPGGLSGTFVPVPIGDSKFPKFVETSHWGLPRRGEDRRWSTLTDAETECVFDQTYGYIAAVAPENEKGAATARIF